jgi:hypothetical protein
MYVIPTTITGIVILLLLILPGFVFVSLRERHQPTRKLSVLRETSVVLAATLTAYLLPLSVIVILALSWPSFRSELASGMSNPSSFEAEHPFHAAMFVAGWIVLGAAMAWLLGSRRLGRLVTSQGGSAWWRMFEPAGLDRTTIEVEVTATLTDGSTITGRLYSWSRDGEDTPDREIVLQQPLWIQPAGNTKVSELGATAMSIAARNIRTVAVRYISLRDQ